jgi:agmatine deiminase
MPGDTMTAGGIASVEQSPVRKHGFILEGGAIDLDGAGRLLTTRECLLNPNRNSDWTETLAERVLMEAFGVTQVIWLDDGLRNDHTDGHVDNIARFIGPGRVLCQAPSGSGDPNADRLRAIEASLRAEGLDVDLIPSPGRILDAAGIALPASHMNFVISNGHVIVPIYEDVHAPRAIAALEAAMPNFDVLGLPARNILAGGGAFHCMTQQIPAFEDVSR